MVNPDLLEVIHMLAEPVAGHLTGYDGGWPWSPQHMSWTPLCSSQPRNVSRMGRGTVQISSEMNVFLPQAFRRPVIACQLRTIIITPGSVERCSGFLCCELQVLPFPVTGKEDFISFSDGDMAALVFFSDRTRRPSLVARARRLPHLLKKLW